MDGIFAGLSAVVELFFELLVLLFGGLGDAAAAFDSKLSPEQRRQRGLKACLKLLLPVSLVLFACWWFIADSRQRARIEATETQVTQYVEQLDQQRDVNGEWIRAQSELTDAWGTPLVIQYERHGLVETVSVTSAGPDRVTPGRDDIAAKRQHVLAKQAVKEAGQVIGDKVKDLFK